MNAGAYTNRGEEVPLGVECALPYGAGRPSQNATGTFPSKEIETFAALRRMFAKARAHSD
jgi:hypothetical protein